eukprot:gb/GECG01012100.1/.p1 GENE.gb/GECG01012100.1/~~gb/GECG01012100.1/.p1  ORF type:complete len:135 (+),score=8.15 gb/GECG01012100.1/:1-405(+)
MFDDPRSIDSDHRSGQRFVTGGRKLEIPKRSQQCGNDSSNKHENSGRFPWSKKAEAARGMSTFFICCRRGTMCLHQTCHVFKAVVLETAKICPFSVSGVWAQGGLRGAKRSGQYVEVVWSRFLTAPNGLLHSVS